MQLTDTPMPLKMRLIRELQIHAFLRKLVQQEMDRRVQEVAEADMIQDEEIYIKSDQSEVQNAETQCTRYINVEPDVQYAETEQQNSEMEHQNAETEVQYAETEPQNAETKIKYAETEHQNAETEVQCAARESTEEYQTIDNGLLNFDNAVEKDGNPSHEAKLDTIEGNNGAENYENLAQEFFNVQEMRTEFLHFKTNLSNIRDTDYVSLVPIKLEPAEPDIATSGLITSPDRTNVTGGQTDDSDVNNITIMSNTISSTELASKHNLTDGHAQDPSNDTHDCDDQNSNNNVNNSTDKIVYQVAPFEDNDDEKLLQFDYGEGVMMHYVVDGASTAAVVEAGIANDALVNIVNICPISTGDRENIHQTAAHDHDDIPQNSASNVDDIHQDSANDAGNIFQNSVNVLEDNQQNSANVVEDNQQNSASDDPPASIDLGLVNENISHDPNITFADKNTIIESEIIEESNKNTESDPIGENGMVTGSATIEENEILAEYASIEESTTLSVSGTVTDNAITAEYALGFIDTTLNGTIFNPTSPTTTCHTSDHTTCPTTPPPPASPPSPLFMWPRAPIHLRHCRPRHIRHMNQLAQQHFWPGIDCEWLFILLCIQ